MFCSVTKNCFADLFILLVSFLLKTYRVFRGLWEIQSSVTVSTVNFHLIVPLNYMIALINLLFSSLLWTLCLEHFMGLKIQLLKVQ